MEITLKMLQDRQACSPHVKLFRRVFPAGAVFNRQNWNKAVARKLDVLWLRKLLPDGLREQYGVAETQTSNRYSAASVAADRQLRKACSDACAGFRRGDLFAYEVGVRRLNSTLLKAVRVRHKAVDAAWDTCLRDRRKVLYSLLQQYAKEQAQA